MFAEVDFSLLDLVAVPTSAHDSERAFLWLNSAGEAFSGLRNEEVRGSDVLGLVPDPWNDRARDEIKRCLEQQALRAYGSVFRRPLDNALVSVKVTLVPLIADGASVGFLAAAAGAGGVSPARTELRLTARQLQVAQLLAEGFGTKEIASLLGLSKETARNHIQAILRRLGASSRIEAIAKARRLGLLTPPPE